MKSLLFFLLLILLTACRGPENDQAFDRAVENLTAFAKVYGHVKYFHPSDEALDIDWDKFAVHGVKTLKNVQYDHSTWSLNPKEPHFEGKYVILNVPGVVSSGETVMGIIDHYQLASTVGQSTAGTNGNSNYINLPGNCWIMWTGMKVLMHDKSQLHLTGYIPDYPVERTIEEIRGNRDEFLEKAIEIIQSNDN